MAAVSSFYLQLIRGEPGAVFKPHHRHYASAFFMDLAASTGFCVVPFFIYDFMGGDAATSGRVASIQSFTYATLCLLTGGFVSRTRNSLLWAVIGASIFAAVLPLGAMSRSLPVFAAVAVVGFCGGALYWPAMQSWLGAEPDPVVRSRRVSHYNIAWCLGLAIAGPIAGYLYSVDYRLAFAFIFVGGAASVALVASLPKEQAVPPVEESCDLRSLAHTANAHLYYAWAANMFGWVLVGVLRAVYTKRVDDLVATGDLTIFLNQGPLQYKAAYYYGWLLLVLYASRIGATYLMGIWHNWHYRFGLMVVSQVAAGVAFYLLAYTNSLVLMALCFAVVGTNGAATFFASLYYSVTDPEHKYRRATIHESMTGFGAAVGAVGFGELAGRLGNTAPLLFTPWIVLAVVVFQYVLLLYGRKRWTKTWRPLV